MADFSLNDINEAKRRVQQMHDKAREYVDETPPAKEMPKLVNATNVKENNGIGDMISSLFSSNDSSIILALVLILSHEKADNMLILALLYILL